MFEAIKTLLAFIYIINQVCKRESYTKNITLGYFHEKKLRLQIYTLMQHSLI